MAIDNLFGFIIKYNSKRKKMNIPQQNKNLNQNWWCLQLSAGVFCWR